VFIYAIVPDKGDKIFDLWPN